MKSTLQFSKNFPDLFPKQPHSIILKEGVWEAVMAIVIAIVPVTTADYIALMLYAVSIGATVWSSSESKTGAPTESMRTGILVNGRAVTDPIKLGYGQCRIGCNINLIHSSGRSNKKLNIIGDWGEGPIEGFVTDALGDKIWLDDKRIQDYQNFQGKCLAFYNIQYGTIKKKDYTTKVKNQANSGAYSIDVFSTARMKIDEDIGIVLDNGSDHWTTIDSITDSDTVVIHDAIPAGRYAPVNALVYTIQVVDPNVVEALDNYVEAYRGTAYSYLKFIYNQAAWASFPLITAELKLRRFKDTRTGDIAWSNNRALAAYDYMISKIYGMRIPESLFDQNSVNDAATWCYDNDYTYDGPYTERNEAGDTLHDIMGPRLDYIWSEGKIKFVIFKDDPAAMNLNEDDIIMRSFQGHIPGIPETPTRMKIWFFDAVDNYARKSLYVEQAEGVIYPTTEDDERTPEAVIYGITDFEKLSKAAKYTFMKARFNKTFSLTGKARCIALEPGNMVTITHRFPKWTNKKLRVISVGIPQSGEIPLVVQEEDPSIYNPAVDVTVHYPYQSTLPDSEMPLDEPTNLIVSTGSDEETLDNKYDAFLEFQWDFEGPGYDYNLMYKKTSVAKWTNRSIKAPYGGVTDPVKTGSGTMNMIVSGDANPTADKNYKCEIDGNYTTLVRIQANAGATTIEVNSTSKFYLQQSIGIILDDSTVHWSEVSQIVDADTVKISTGIPSGRYAPVNAYIYPQTFKWSDTGGAAWNETGVPVRGSIQSLIGYILIHGTTINQTPQANSAAVGDVDFMASSPAVGHCNYFIGILPFSQIKAEIYTQGVGAWTGVWEYSNGLAGQSGWISLQITSDQILDFRSAPGSQGLRFAIPSDWERTYISGIYAFAVRYRITSFTNMTTRPKGSWIRLWGTSNWVTLSNNVKVSFDALIGAVIGDYWTFTATCPNPVQRREGGLPCNTIFEWKVRSVNPDGRKSEWMIGDQITTWGPAPPPDVSFVDANCKFDTIPVMVWTAITPEPLIYEIRSENANWGEDDDKHVATLTRKYIKFQFNNFIAWCDDLGLTEAQRRSITFYIKAKNKGNVYSANADSIALTNSAPSMSGYSPLATPHSGGKHVIVNWKTWSGITLPDIDKYNVYCSTEAVCTINATNLKKTVGKNSHQTEITALSKKVQYDFRVVPWDDYGEGTPSN